MSTLKRNTIANFLGTGYSGVVSLALVPLYINLLGGEAYGVIAVQATLLSIIAFLDLGMGLAINREVAILAASDRKFDIRNVIGAARLLYLAMAVVFGLALFLAAPFVGTNWLETKAISPIEVGRSLRFAAVMLPAVFVSSLYQAVLLGLQRHVVLNVVLVASMTARAAGGVAIALATRRVSDVMLWYAVTAVAQLVAVAVAVRVAMPDVREPAPLRFDALASPFRLVAGLGWVGALAVVTSQIDKIVISRMASLETFGYYGATAAAATIVVGAAAPVAAAAFPRFSELVARGATDQLGSEYRRSSEIVSVLVFPVTSMFVLFPREVLQAWTGDFRMVQSGAAVLPLLAAAWTANAVNYIPYSMQLAHGVTRIAVMLQVSAALFVPPLTVAAFLNLGAWGVAAVFLAMHLGMLVVSAAVTHARFLPGVGLLWLRADVMTPLVASIAVAGVARLTMPATNNRLTLILLLGVAGLSCLAAAGMSSPLVRLWVAELWHSRKAGERAA